METRGLDYSYAEKTVLGIILFSENIGIETIDRVLSCTTENMFIDYQARAVYKAIKETYKEHSEIIGTSHYVYKINLMVSIEHKNMEMYVFDLEKHWSPLQTLDYWLNKVQDEYFAIRFEEAKTEREFIEIIAEKEKYKIITDMDNIANECDKVLNEYENRKKSAIFTSYPSINQYIGSLQGGDMIVLAGSTGGGKTCMMLNLALGIAKQGKKVDIFSLEMPKAQLQQRIICSEAKIDAQKFRAFSLSNEEKSRFNKYATNEFKKLNIRIFKKQTVTIEEIRRIERKSNADIIFIDYLGLIDSYGNKSSYEKFSEISRNIKLLAMESNKPIIALHQLNREFQNREDKKPKTSDLRDSGKIEQDADMIWFVYRPAIFDASKKQDELVFIIAKNRHGETNKEVNLQFIGKYQQVIEREG